MNQNGNGNGTRVPAIDRAVQILQTLASSDAPLGVSELSRRLHLNKSTVHDLLSTLSHHHLIERNDAAKTYRLGYGLTQLAHYANDRSSVRAVAHPYLSALARAVDETVYLGTFHAGHVTILDKEEPPHDFKITAPLGRRLHYSAGAFGKTFLAALTEIDALKLMRDKPPRAFTPNSITKTADYRAALREVRAQGYALDDEEYLAGVRAVAAPINDARGRVTGALCVVGFKTRMPMDKLVRIAKQTCLAARTISRQLGAVEYPAWKGVG